MCGRYTLTTSPQALQALFCYEETVSFPPRYNVAPTQPIAVVRLTEGKRRFVLMRWGLLPSWVKDPKSVSLMFNARGETARDKPAFRNAMAYRRCLIPADGFYEWRAIGGGRKRPYYVRKRDGGPLAFAGLWETWTGPNGEELDTAAVVTTRANYTLRPIHDRMPVIIPPEAFARWLDCAQVDAAAAACLIVPAPDDLLEACEIGTAVNSSANDGPKLIEPVAATLLDPARTPGRQAPANRAKKDDRQPSLF